MSINCSAEDEQTTANVNSIEKKGLHSIGHYVNVRYFPSMISRWRGKNEVQMETAEKPTYSYRKVH